MDTDQAKRSLEQVSDLLSREKELYDAIDDQMVTLKFYNKHDFITPIQHAEIKARIDTHYFIFQNSNAFSCLCNQLAGFELEE